MEKILEFIILSKKRLDISPFIRRRNRPALKPIKLSSKPDLKINSDFSILVFYSWDN